MDLNYLLFRQQVERSRAMSATCEKSRRVHEALARHYEAMIARLTGGRVRFA